jgi:hypothetical protein
MIKYFIFVAFTWLAGRGFSQSDGHGNLEKELMGKHKFGVQFIWDKYGTAAITKEKGVLKISGSQYSNDKSEYCLLEGTIQMVDAVSFVVTGDLKLFTKDCCGEIQRRGEYLFLCKNNRKFWRYQHFNEICSSDKCAYYLDIFKN